MSVCGKCEIRESTHWIGGEAFVCERCYARHVLQPRPTVDLPPPEVEVRCDNPVPWAAIALCFGAAVCMIVAVRLGWL